MRATNNWQIATEIIKKHSVPSAMPEIPYQGKMELRIDDDETRLGLEALMWGDKLPLAVVLERLPDEVRNLLPKDIGEWAHNRHCLELRGITLEYRIV